jgi:hypothetical protein
LILSTRDVGIGSNLSKNIDLISPRLGELDKFGGRSEQIETIPALAPQKYSV